MIKFHLPRGVKRFNLPGLRDEYEKLYLEGFTEEYAMPGWMRPPVAGETVELRGHTPGFEVRYVSHIYGPEDDAEQPFVPHTYVVLR